MAHGTHETEIKLAVPDVASGRRLLRAAGFRVFKRRVFEVNRVFDTPGLKLRKAGTLLRVRQVGRNATLTYKGPAEASSKHKSREELEVALSDGEAMSAIAGRLGFEQVWRYEKYRTEYKQPRGAGVATLDETPVGVFLELEGTPSFIDRAARDLGFSEADYITGSYGTLYRDWCRRKRIRPGDMVF